MTAMGSRAYLDYNASAPLTPHARAAMLAALEDCGNASSVHAEGRLARKRIEGARSALAGVLRCEPKQVIFTSGATEAANMALTPVLMAGGQALPVSRLFMGAGEHACILAGGRFAKTAVESVPIGSDGLVDPDNLARQLATHDQASGAAMVAIQHANNETGVIQPLEAIGEVVRRHQAILLVDAVQSLGKMPVNLAALHADIAIFSAHKLGGPQGAGALVLASPALGPPALLRGGGQENHHRAGTENVAAIAGFGAAAENCGSDVDFSRISRMRDSIEAQLRTISREAGSNVGEPVFFGAAAPRLGNTSCFAVEGIRAETALIALDLAGVAVSSGSACSSGKVGRSHVLSAMGVGNNLASAALRVSIGRETGEEQIGRFTAAWKDIVRRMASAAA
ncbi:MAG: cysteine desulfurase family protein [Rhizobiaceae bacterium]